jgi:chromosome partitioning protein
LERPITLAGIVITRVGRTSYFRSQTAKTLRTAFPDSILNSEIKERSSVAESAAKNVSIFAMGDNMAAAEFSAFGDELLERLGI